MPDVSDTIPAEALEDIAYLARSANRIEILGRLRSGSFSRRDLADRTGASRTTLDRIVNELEARGWAERTTDGEYTATPAGALLMAQTTPFIESVAAIRRLGEAIDWLPMDELDIGLEHFSNASVLRPEQDDPVETVDYILDLLRATNEFRALTHFAPPSPLSKAMRDRIATGRMTAEIVLTGELVTYLSAQPERRGRWREMLQGGADVAKVDGPIPCNLWIFDDTVLIKKSGPGEIRDSYGVPIQSSNGRVRSWAHDLIDRWRSDAALVEPRTFAEDQAVP